MKWFNKLIEVMRSAKSRDSPKVGSSHVEGWDSPDTLSLLTIREREVFKALLRVRKVKDATTELGIKYPTLHTHCKNIYKKLKVNSRAELIIRYGVRNKNS